MHAHSSFPGEMGRAGKANDSPEINFQSRTNPKKSVLEIHAAYSFFKKDKKKNIYFSFRLRKASIA